ncbi:hypothetical protein BH18ACT1_BH18ACT1_19490 [soil metagenome]
MSELLKKVDPKQAAAGMLVGRFVAGTALLLTPGLAARVWIGPKGTEEGARVLARVVGVRDLLLAYAAMAADAAGTRGRSLRVEAATDAGDALAVVLGGRHVTPLRRVVLPLVAGGSAAFEWWLAGQID